MNILMFPCSDDKKTFARLPNATKTLRSKHRVFGIKTNNNPLEKVKTFLTAKKILQTEKIDLLYCTAAENAFLGSLLAKEFRKPMIFDSYGSVVLFAESLKKGVVYRKLFGFFEEQAAKKADAIITVSEADKIKILEYNIKKEKIFVIPVWIDSKQLKEQLKAGKKQSASKIKKLAFFGSFGYLPNRIALDFILEKIVPTIGEKTIINIFGSGTVNKTTNKNVHFHGFVDNLAWEIKNSDAVIAPIWKGVGILEKVLVSMACGKTVITTNFAKKGIPDLKNNENAIIAETEKQFLEKTINFLEGKYNASKIGRNAKALIKRKYSNKMAKRLLEIVECVTK